MAGVRFEDVDLLGALSRIVDLHTQHYKEDFDLDKELMLLLSYWMKVPPLLIRKMKRKFKRLLAN